jgi:hypothetical protein
MAVAPIATSSGKKRPKAGSISVPSPKPEKKVKMAPRQTTIGMTTISKVKRF